MRRGIVFRAGRKHRAIGSTATVALVLATVTGCVAAGGQETQRWLQAQPGVTKVHTDYSVSGLQYIPTVTATVDVNAPDRTLKRLAEHAAQRLDSGEAGAAKITLVSRRISLSVYGDLAPEAADLWAQLRRDKRINDGGVIQLELILAVKRSEMMAVFRDHLDPKVDIDIFQSDAENDDDAVSIRAANGCTPTPAQLDVAASLISDPSHAGSRLSLCGETELAVPSPSAIPDAVTSMATSGLSHVTVVSRPEYGSDRWRYTVAADEASPSDLRLIATLAALPGISGFEMRPGGAVTVKAPLRSASSVFDSPDLVGLRQFEVVEGDARVRAGSKGEFAAYASLAESIASITPSQFAARPGNISVEVDPESFTPSVRSRIVSAISLSGLATGRKIYLVDWDQHGAVIDDGVAEPNTSGKIARSVVELWNSTFH